MRVTGIDLYSSDSIPPVQLSFRDPTGTRQFYVKNITGLDADELTPRFYGTSFESGRNFYELSMRKREIVMQIALNPSYGPNQGVSDLRDDIYRLISASREGTLQLRFKNDKGVVAVISGFVAKVEVSHFTKVPEVRVSVECTSAMFTAPGPVEVDVSVLSNTNSIIYDGESTAPHGFEFEIEVLLNCSLLMMQQGGDYVEWFFQVAPAGGFLDGDIIQCSSVPENKYLRYVRGASTVNIVDSLLWGSQWPIMFPGENEFAVQDELDFQWKSITYYPTYWGV